MARLGKLQKKSMKILARLYYWTSCRRWCMLATSEHIPPHTKIVTLHLIQSMTTAMKL